MDVFKFDIPELKPAQVLHIFFWVATGPWTTGFSIPGVWQAHEGSETKAQMQM